jgi:hypothetical protein
MLSRTKTVPTPVIIAQLLAILGSAVLVAGCDDGKPKRVPVSGTVLIDGKPLTMGTVRMFPASGGRPASGQIGPDGRFAMTTFQLNDGAVVGSNRVEIRAVEPISDSTSRWHAPQKYATAETSGLEISIDQPIDDLELAITWDGGKPFIEMER